MTPRLSILICSISSRADLLARLMTSLTPQLSDVVEVLTDTDAGEVDIGSKRNRLTSRSSGSWLCFVDDDDALHPSYCNQILAAIDSSPDCVGFKSRRFLDGKHVGDCSYSIRNAGHDDDIDYANNFRMYKRTPGHLTPIKREHVIATPFQPWCYGEDRDFERRVLPRLKTEVFIDDYLYDYLRISRENRKAEKVHPWRWRLGKQPLAIVRTKR